MFWEFCHIYGNVPYVKQVNLQVLVSSVELKTNNKKTFDNKNIKYSLSKKHFFSALFNDDDDDEVRQLRTGILSLIQKYLSSLPGVSVTAEMVNIGLALQALPVLARCCNNSWSGHSTRRNIVWYRCSLSETFVLF